MPPSARAGASDGHVRLRAWMRGLILCLCALFSGTGLGQQPPGTPPPLTLPNAPDSIKFGVIGDSGTGEKAQYDIGAQMALFHQRFLFDFVIMLGDNMYGRQEPGDFVRKFELPYMALLDQQVRFYASLGNHDSRQNRYYGPFNMQGERYYTFARGAVRFFVLDTNDFDAAQQEWLGRQLRASKDDWKIAYFHHPIYSSAARHGSSLELRALLEPLFVEHGMNVVFQGHDHVYERIRPQQGIAYFVEGSSAKIRRGNLRRSPITAAGNDRDRTFMLVEVKDDVLSFQTIARSGATVESGQVLRHPAARQSAQPGAAR